MAMDITNMHRTHCEYLVEAVNRPKCWISQQICHRIISCSLSLSLWQTVAIAGLTNSHVVVLKLNACAIKIAAEMHIELISVFIHILCAVLLTSHPSLVVLYVKQIKISQYVLPFFAHFSKYRCAASSTFSNTDMPW